MPESLAVQRAKECSAIARVHEVLDEFAARDHNREILTAIRHFPAREAQWADFPGWVNGKLRSAYAAKGVSRLYTHQAAAAEAVHSGRNVVIVTPTASGKTLCYNLPVLNAILENSDTRALYLFPTKALAQDQLAELYDLNQRLDHGFGVFTYDGDTPGDARKAIREKGHAVLTNPDMLHTGILPTGCSRICGTSFSTNCTPTAAFSAAICAMSFAGCAASRVFTDASRNSFAAPRPSQIPANWLLASSNPRLQSSIPTARLPQRKLLSSTILRRLIERWAFAAITSTNRRELHRSF